jgi:Uma2 family endonuclease
MAATGTLMTAEELLNAPELGRCELVRGELVMMSPAGFDHGRIALTIGRLLGNFVSQHALGVVLSAETGFQIAHDPDTVRAPDAAFVRSDRVPPTGMFGFFRGPPDLAVEVLSPGDRASEVNAKVQDWLDAGCQLVWVADPRTRIVTAYRSRREVAVFATGDILTAGDVVPGFSIPVGEIFGT